jgi:hypothetical protein
MAEDDAWERWAVGYVSKFPEHAPAIRSMPFLVGLMVLMRDTAGASLKEAKEAARFVQKKDRPEKVYEHWQKLERAVRRLRKESRAQEN